MGPKTRVLLFKAVGSLLEALPERLDVALARSLGATLGNRSAGMRANLADNLAHVVASEGERPDEQLLEEFVARGFRNYGHYWAEGAKLPALSVSTITERFAIAEGVEHLYAAKERGRGTIMALPHIGSWEWGGAYLHTLDLTMTAVAEVLNPPELFDWFKEKREAMGIHVEALDDRAASVLLTTLRSGGVVGLLCDRDIQGNGIDVEFFGRRVAMPAGPATLALRSGATLVAAACYTGPGRDHFAVVTPPIAVERTKKLRDDVARVTQSVTRELEGLIRRAPEQWHVLERRFPPS
ncbi:MAG: Phosphatidylinositol mannoside acyltransferase [Acidimicrobiaceae bacterium]|nr:Phosphatidylinositol mannoside acyltransferase [Acidimicrobiaceae bacterium]